MKFDFAIGNPPYQREQISEDADGSLKNYAPPVYNYFIDAAERVARKVELIHPARFLFNAGSTPKAWNEAKLNDEHLCRIDPFDTTCTRFRSGRRSPHFPHPFNLIIQYPSCNRNIFDEKV